MAGRIDGWLGFSNPLSTPTEFDEPAPFVACTIEHDGHEFPLDFLVDTGSDVTTIMPGDAHMLLGDAYFKLDFRNDAEALQIEVAGDGGYVALPLDVTLHLEDQLGNDVEPARRLWIAEAPDEEYSDGGKWQLPSIFGRDAIRPDDE